MVVFDYRESFANLWSKGLSTDNRTALEQRIILLVGTEPPADAFSTLIPQAVEAPIAFSEHFTAYSWAAVYKLRKPKSRAVIVILDPDAHSWSDGAATDMRELYAQEGSRTPPVIPGVLCMSNPSLSGIINGLSARATDPLGIRQQAMLRGIIQQRLLPSPDEHHHLGNVIGALMLAASGDSPPPGSHPIAGLLQALQPATGFHQPTGHKFELDQKLRDALAKDVPCVLFDDMGELWRPFVRQWVPDNLLHIPPVTDDSRTRLVRRLHALVSEPAQKRQLNASDFGVISVADGQPFILLLDLRLFSTSQADKAKELLFVDSLARLAEAVGAANHLKWPSISEVEVSEVLSAWTDRQPHKPNYRKARSWLPRLISLLDPTLPIATFSSTQDPEVLKEFAPYGNIVTDFAKPAFRGILGEAEEWTGAAYRSFEKALDATLKIRAGQTKIRTICLPWIAPSQNQSRRSSLSQVEVFLDESGTADQTRFAVGAVVLISGSSPFIHSSYRADALMGLGPGGLWGLDDLKSFDHIGQFPSPDRRLSKGDLMETGVTPDGTNYNNLLNVVLSGINELVGKQGASVVACSLLSDELPDSTAIASTKHPFHRYRIMLTRLLEAILFHCDPVVQAIRSGATICIDAATTENKAAAWRPEALTTDFGADLFIKPSDGLLYCRTIANSDVLPIVTGLLVRNGREALANKVTRARAVPLLDFAKCEANPAILGYYSSAAPNLPPKPLPKQLHYLADWIAHFTWHEKDRNETPNILTLNTWFKNGFRQADRDQLRQHLRCQRQWALGARLSALQDCATIPDTCEDALALIPRLKVKASHWLSDLSGQETNSLFRRERSG
jgi:hypothetical protein